MHQDPFSQNFGMLTVSPVSTIGDLNTVAGNYGEWSNIWQIGMVSYRSN